MSPFIYWTTLVQHSLFETFIRAFSQGNGSKRPLILYFSFEASGGRDAHRFAYHSVDYIQIINIDNIVLLFGMRKKK